MKTNFGKRVLTVFLVFALVLTAGGCRSLSLFFRMNDPGRKTSSAVEYLKERLSALGEEVSKAAEEAARESEAAAKESEAAEAAAKAEQGIWNILLIGSDRRDTSWNGNSDTMILVSVNENTQNLRMVSFMRDTYVSIPGAGGRKLNAAYALGGAPLLMETIRSNFSVAVDNYVAIDFSAMVVIINTMGGIDIELNAEEAVFMGLPAGINHMDGEQALTYSRIRNIGNADYERTSRQRRVLSAMLSQFKVMNNAARISAASQLFGVLQTDIGAEKIAWLLTNIGNLVNYGIVTDRVPYDGLYTFSGEDLVPDYEATKARLYQFLH